MALLSSITRLSSPCLMNKDGIRKAWTENPNRLINFLGMKGDISGYGYLCPYCGSGSGENGTGMASYLAEKSGYLRLKCFASQCEKNVDAFQLVMDLHNGGTSFTEAQQLLALLYAQKETQWDTEPDSCKRSRHHQRNQMLDPGRLRPVYQRSIEARRACPQWQQRLADAMGLPVSAFDRPDIGKAFYVDSAGNSDEFNEDCGDLVTYTLYDGYPFTAKVRYTPGLNSYDGVMLYYNTEKGAFDRTVLRNRNAQHDFRMAGKSGEVCFGHDTLTDAETVVIVEGQSDVLAVASAFQEMGMPKCTAIGRDSASHIIGDVDVRSFASKQVIYAEDYDTISSATNKQNIKKLLTWECPVRVWSAPSPQIKDPRAFYLSYGSKALVESLLSAPIYNLNTEKHD